jgi:hypothetical protein
MTFTYKFYDKAEDATPIDVMTFDGDSEKDVQEAVHDYCDTYGYEAYVLIPSKAPKAEPKQDAEGAQKKVWTQDEIKNLVQTNDTMLYRSLLKLYECQTSTEQYSGSTRERNGKGFNSVDAKFLTSVSEFLKHKGFLTDKQKAATRRKLVKYTGQLTRIANA